MATTRLSAKTTHGTSGDALPTLSRKVLTAASALAVAAFIVLSESVSPVPLAILACIMVAVGFSLGTVAWLTKAPVDRPHATIWDYAGTILFAGFALATALGSSWMNG